MLGRVCQNCLLTVTHSGVPHYVPIVYLYKCYVCFFLFSCVLGNRTGFFLFVFLLFCGLFTGKWAALNTLLYVLWHTKMTFDIQSNSGYFPSSLCLCLPAGWILLLHQIKYALYIHNNCHDMRKMYMKGFVEIKCIYDYDLLLWPLQINRSEYI